MMNRKKIMGVPIMCFCVVIAVCTIGIINHFLSDVCFGTLITYVLYAVVSSAFLDAARK